MIRLTVRETAKMLAEHPILTIKGAPYELPVACPIIGWPEYRMAYLYGQIWHGPFAHGKWELAKFVFGVN